MPGLNRQGPLGEGPMTGRKAGRCSSGDVCRDAGGWGWGWFGAGRGRKMGGRAGSGMIRRRQNVTMDPLAELQYLDNLQEYISQRRQYLQSAQGGQSNDQGQQ